MLKRSFAGSIALGMMLASAGWAHHIPGHEEGPEPPGFFDIHDLQQFQLPPSITNPEGANFPQLAPPILPTDVSGLRSGPDASKLQQAPTPAQLTPEQVAALSAPDSRYQFTGEWILFSSQYSAILPSQTEYRLVAFEPSDNSIHFGRVEQIESHPPKSGEPAFMPTKDAKYSKINDEHLALQSGAVLVKAGDHPVFVSTEVAGEKVMTRVTGGALAMISAFDGRATTLNLTDKCCSALVLYAPTADRLKQHSVTMRPGEIAEVYAPNDQPKSNLVATKIDVNQRLSNNFGLLVSQCNYVRALKKFNLTAVMGKPELDRVLKTAAAIRYLHR